MSPEVANPSIEVVSAYWDARPCNIRHSPKPLGSREYFEEVEQRKYFVEPHIPGFAEFEKWEGKRVLEIGCGIGTDAVNFARAGAKYTGLELSANSLELAKRRFDIFGLSGDFYLANAEEIDLLGLEEDSFDLIYSFGVLHHTPNPSVALGKARNLLRANGELRIMLYAKNSWKAIMVEAGLDQPEAQSGCPIALTFSEAEAVSLLESQGFNTEEVRRDHLFMYNVEKYVNYEYELEPWFKSMGETRRRALERSLGWHMLLKASKVA